MRAWRPLTVGDIAVSDFAAVEDEKAAIDFLLIGTGSSMARLPPAVQTHLTKMGLRYDAMSTSAAIHTYNVVLDEGRRVAAALLAVEKAHDR
jgi:uncharacterized protein